MTTNNKKTESKTNNKKTENKTNVKATIFCVENKFNHDECCVTSIFHARKNDGTEIEKTSVKDFPKDEFKRIAVVRWSNSMLCNFLKTTPDDLVNKLPYQPNFDVRVKYTKSIVDSKAETIINFMDISVWSKVRKYFVEFEIDNLLPFPADKQDEMLSLDNLAGYENV